ncbi:MULTISPECIES: low molecular weight phosphatase family protein [Brevibacterium]|uniref:Phosphatase n=1 Tax=Brevibacterium aurantiacum TaxID=273384 RepID=A0A2A3ZI76_BREAU|nr:MULTISPECIES: low molecular weight phosphatase family protein [Brevibacterium]MDN5586887.1 low molecular weight phosphatase family protein [Brevibacterium sp.]MDN5657985.1 low molecular weight phosphatase family protein [Brevibacterium sandarakinum]PCC51299.1 phosphatase [Brevibacterium aurantiacum]RCS92993.1 low molecular weight phosphatase family protein [Brevibacterium aurantiacum]
MNTPPRVLFVCVKNGGKSQMAAGLMRDIAGDSVDVRSGGTTPGAALNQLSVQSLAEWNIDISEGSPKPITEADLEGADLVVTLGREAKVHAPEGTAVENWDTDEPSGRGIEGIERMRMVRDDINDRVRDLLSRLTS